MRTITIGLTSLLLASITALSFGCSKAEPSGPGAAAVPRSDAAVPPPSPDLEALPTVEEVEQQAFEQINEENVDEALQQLEAELDADPDAE